MQALWADCVRQLKFKRNYSNALSDDPFTSAGVVGDATALLGSKIKAGNFLVKVQQARQNGGVERSADEEKKMGEEKIACVEQNGVAPRSAQPTPNGPLRSLTPDRTKIVWA